MSQPAAASRKGGDMRKQIIPGVLAGIAILMIVGCGAGGTAAKATAEEEKNFKGGPMPPEVRKQFLEDQQRLAALRAAKIQEAAKGAATGPK